MRRKILFVDDDPNLLDGLRRTFRGLRKEWALAFAQSGYEAMTMLENVSFDVVVCDTRVTGMDGVKLLTEVLNKHPDMVRIVLSATSDKDTAMRNVYPAHQYLVKPYEAEKLKELLIRACYLRDRLTDDRLKAVVARMDSLPSMPALYADLMDELGSENASIQTVGDIISKDVGMTAKILKLVNSALFGCRTQITSTSQAVGLLGLDTIRGLVLSVQIFSQFDESKLGDFSAQALWNHSMKVGAWSNEIAKLEKVDRALAGDTFMAGILHDCGKLVLAANFPDKYGQALSRAQEGQIFLCDAEQEVFGTTHEEVGAYLMGLWGLPDSIVETLAFHHRPLDCPYEELSPLTFVHAVNIMEHRSREESYPHEELDEEYLTRFGFMDRIPAWQAKLEELACEEAAT